MMHLLIDGLCDPMLTPYEAEGAILLLCREIKMTPWGESHVGSFPDGYTIYQLIVESHIIVHTQDGYMNIDIFSCKPFDADSAIRFCKSAFNMEQPKTQLLERKFGKDMNRE